MILRHVVWQLDDKRLRCTCTRLCASEYHHHAMSSCCWSVAVHVCSYVVTLDARRRPDWRVDCPVKCLLCPPQVHAYVIDSQCDSGRRCFSSEQRHICHHLIIPQSRQSVRVLVLARWLYLSCQSSRRISVILRPRLFSLPRNLYLCRS